MIRRHDSRMIFDSVAVGAHSKAKTQESSESAADATLPTAPKRNSNRTSNSLQETNSNSTGDVISSVVAASKLKQKPGSAGAHRLPRTTPPYTATAMMEAHSPPVSPRETALTDKGFGAHATVLTPRKDLLKDAFADRPVNTPQASPLAVAGRSGAKYAPGYHISEQQTTNPSTPQQHYVVADTASSMSSGVQCPLRQFYEVLFSSRVQRLKILDAVVFSNTGEADGLFFAQEVNLAYETTWPRVDTEIHQSKGLFTMKKETAAAARQKLVMSYFSTGQQPGSAAPRALHLSATIKTTAPVGDEDQSGEERFQPISPSAEDCLELDVGVTALDSDHLDASIVHNELSEGLLLKYRPPANGRHNIVRVLFTPYITKVEKHENHFDYADGSVSMKSRCACSHRSRHVSVVFVSPQLQLAADNLCDTIFQAMMREGVLIRLAIYYCMEIEDGSLVFLWPGKLELRQANAKDIAKVRKNFSNSTGDARPASAVAKTKDGGTSEKALSETGDRRPSAVAEERAMPSTPPPSPLSSALVLQQRIDMISSIKSFGFYPNDTHDIRPESIKKDISSLVNVVIADDRQSLNAATSPWRRGSRANITSRLRGIRGTSFVSSSFAQSSALTRSTRSNVSLQTSTSNAATPAVTGLSASPQFKKRLSVVAVPTDIPNAGSVVTALPGSALDRRRSSAHADRNKSSLRHNCLPDVLFERGLQADEEENVPYDAEFIAALCDREKARQYFNLDDEGRERRPRSHASPTPKPSMLEVGGFDAFLVRRLTATSNMLRRKGSVRPHSASRDEKSVSIGAVTAPKRSHETSEAISKSAEKFDIEESSIHDHESVGSESNLGMSGVPRFESPTDVFLPRRAGRGTEGNSRSPSIASEERKQPSSSNFAAPEMLALSPEAALTAEVPVWQRHTVKMIKMRRKYNNRSLAAVEEESLMREEERMKGIHSYCVSRAAKEKRIKESRLPASSNRSGSSNSTSASKVWYDVTHKEYRKKTPYHHNDSICKPKSVVDHIISKQDWKQAIPRKDVPPVPDGSLMHFLNDCEDLEYVQPPTDTPIFVPKEDITGDRLNARANVRGVFQQVEVPTPPLVQFTNGYQSVSEDLRRRHHVSNILAAQRKRQNIKKKSHNAKHALFMSTAHRTTTLELLFGPFKLESNQETDESKTLGEFIDESHAGNLPMLEHTLHSTDGIRTASSSHRPRRSTRRYTRRTQDGIEEDDDEDELLGPEWSILDDLGAFDNQSDNTSERPRSAESQQSQSVRPSSVADFAPVSEKSIITLSRSKAADIFKEKYKYKTTRSQVAALQSTIQDLMYQERCADAGDANRMAWRDRGANSGSPRKRIDITPSSVTSSTTLRSKASPFLIIQLPPTLTREEVKNVRALMLAIGFTEALATPGLESNADFDAAIETEDTQYALRMPNSAVFVARAAVCMRIFAADVEKMYTRQDTTRLDRIERLMQQEGYTFVDAVLTCTHSLIHRAQNMPLQSYDAIVRCIGL